MMGSLEIGCWKVANCKLKLNKKFFVCSFIPLWIWLWKQIAFLVFVLIPNSNWKEGSSHNGSNNSSLFKMILLYCSAPFYGCCLDVGWLVLFSTSFHLDGGEGKGFHGLLWNQFDFLFVFHSVCFNEEIFLWYLQGISNCPHPCKQIRLKDVLFSATAFLVIRSSLFLVFKHRKIMNNQKLTEIISYHPKVRTKTIQTGLHVKTAIKNVKLVK